MNAYSSRMIEKRHKFVDVVGSMGNSGAVTRTIKGQKSVDIASRNADKFWGIVDSMKNVNNKTVVVFSGVSPTEIGAFLDKYYYNNER